MGHDEEIMLYPHQKEIIDWVLCNLDNKIQRFIINAMCGAGKTHIAQHIMKHFLFQGKRILFLAYTKNELREQSYNRFLNDKIIPKEFVGIFKQEKKELDKQLITTIPQTINRFQFPFKFDLIIIDEAHEYLETKNKRSAKSLKKIIANNSRNNTIIIGLTGTAFEVMLEGKFFDIKNEQVAYKIYDSVMALNDKIISNIRIFCHYVNFELKSEAYKKDGELSKIGQEVVKSKLINALKVNQLIYKLKGKTLVICAKISDAESLTAYINSSYGNGNKIALCKTSNQENLFEIDLEFKKHPKIQFLVVVGMCGIGWDYPELVNVVDLTFTMNPKLIIQRFSRAIRRFEDKEPNYYYIADERKTPLMVRNLLFHALFLTTKTGIEMYVENNGNTSAPVFPLEMNRYNSISSMDDFFNEFEKEIKKRDVLKIGDLKSYLFLVHQKTKSEMIFNMSLKQLKTSEKDQYHFIQKLYLIHPQRTTQILNLHLTQKRLNPNSFKLYRAFKDFKNLCDKTWKIFFGETEPENMLL